MEKIKFSFLMVIIPFIHLSQSHKYDWVKTWGDIPGQNDLQMGEKIAVDVNGNVYVFGYFYNSGDFDPGPSQQFLSESGTKCLFLSKFDNNGNFIWSKQLVSSNNFDKSAIGIETDLDGNVYLTGTFKGSSADFDPSLTNSVIIWTNGNNDVFLTKLNSNGDHIFTKTFGGGYDDFVTDIEISQSSILITGSVKGNNVDFDPGTGQSILSCQSNTGYIASYSLDGIYEWYKPIGFSSNSSTESIVNGISIDESNNIYITGNYNGTCNFNINGTNELTPLGGSKNGFVNKLNSNGDFIWVKQFGSQGELESYKIAVSSGNLYVVGKLTTIGYFDMSNTSTFNVYGFYDGFLCKLTTDGTTLFVGNIGGIPYNVQIDLTNEILIGGEASENDDLDPGSGNFYVTNSTTSTYSEGFISKFSTDCNFLWAKTIGEDNQSETIHDVAISSNNEFYSTGGFIGTVNFNTENGSSLNTATYYDAFLHKLKPCSSESIDIIENCGPYTWIDGITYTSSNNSAKHYLTNSQGCDSIIHLNLTITGPSAIISTSSNGSLVTLTSGTYQWINCVNNSIIDGQTNAEFFPTENGQYAVIVTSAGCSDTSGCYTIDNIGIDSNDDVIDLKIYPNPSSNGKFTVSFLKSMNHLRVTIFSLDGKIVSQKEINNSNQFNIELNGSDGTYFMEIETDKQLKSIYRIIKN